MANVLSQSPGLVCTHEPVPRLVEETARWRYGDLSTADYGQMLTESRPATVGGFRYGESANRLSLGVPVLADVFDSSQFVWLLRDGRDVVSSGYQRGWYDHAADTVWERYRLRGDRLGEIDEAEWAAWSPFRRICWLWTRTNTMIRDDLAALGPARSMTVRLEQLDSAVDSIAGFLGGAATDWVIPRLNARGKGQVDEPGVNRVDRRWVRANWSDENHEVFDEVCGALMDDLYPTWRADDGDETDRGPEDPDPAGAVSAGGAEAAFADVRSLRAEVSILADHVQRVDRRGRGQAAELEAERGKIRERDDRIRRLEAERSAAEVVIASSAEKVADLERKLDEIRTSSSFRFGHAIALTARRPIRLLSAVRRRLPGGFRPGARTAVVGVSRRVARLPGAPRLATVLPDGIRQKLHTAVGTPTPASAGPRERRRTPTVNEPGLGLRAVLADEVSADDWQGGLDIVEAREAGELTNLDLILTGPTVSRELEDEAARWPDAAVVAVHERLPPIPAGLTPLGFGREHDDTFLSLDSAMPGSPSPGRSVVQRTIEKLPDPLTDAEGFRLAAQTHVGVVDSGTEASLRRAVALTRLCAAGLPVSIADPAAYVGLVPAEILDDWAATSPRVLTVEHAREHASHRQRGLVHDHLSRRAVFDTLLRNHDRPGLPSMSVSVTIATNRPDMVDHWSQQLELQDHPDFEVIAALHGDRFDDATVDRLHARLGQRLTVVRVDNSYSLGDALNAATRAAGGDLLVKWDDDDFYDHCHLRDLVRAKEYSGATLVGKAAEFVYLAGLDRTVRRLKTSSEAFSRTIGGPTLAINRAELRELGGWRRTRRRVDSMLIEDVTAAGGTTYRTSGFGFVMMRSGGTGHAHTWTPGDDYFLDGAIDQRPGLDLEFCGVRAPEAVVAPWV